MFSQNREKMNSKKRSPLDGDIHSTRIDSKFGQFVNPNVAKERSKVKRRAVSKNIIKNELSEVQELAKEIIETVKEVIDDSK